jgi:hypothetical protein
MKLFTLCSLLFVLNLNAAEKREAHGNHEDEQRCLKEIRSLGCGKPENHETFIACVDQKISLLTPGCQAFHGDEKERMAGHQH